MHSGVSLYKYYINNTTSQTGVIKMTFSSVNTIWVLLGAALVFFMQAGFSLCEAGFTRAKNTGNILMKNLMDFCIGTPAFWLVGFGIMFGSGTALFGKLDPMIMGDYSAILPEGVPLWAYAIFQTVFCATSATIVSGAMAERTKFISYCIYSFVISLVVYPIEAHWIWGGGWLAQLGFVDFAGSTAIHMVGGLTALIGAAMGGPRIGKFSKDGKPRAILGHSIPLGALGVFILWFGWYGFNGAAASNVDYLADIFLTTTIAPAVATVVTMIFTWLKNGKPDVSMCLNASLAGLVAITAGCDVTDALGAIVIGGVAGVLVVFGVWLLDHKLHVDDPVGAVAVHLMNGVWGTLAVGLFATPTAPAFARGFGDGVTFGANQIMGAGLFYGGGFTLLGIQIIGVAAILAFTAVTITLSFLAIRATVGLRVSEQEEIVGLDVEEHGLVSAYAGFMPVIGSDVPMGAPAELPGAKPAAKDEAVPVADYSTGSNDKVKMSKVTIVTKQSMFERLKSAMDEIGVTGMTVTQVLGCGMQKGRPEYYRGVEMETSLLPKIEVDIVVCKIPVRTVIDAAKNALYTGHIGDGKIFVYDVEQVVKVRTGEEGYDALQDVE